MSGRAPRGYLTAMDLEAEKWQTLAERHRQCSDDPRRCRDCQAYWPCAYRLRADRELCDFALR
ncbi:hypothetical protein AB0C04_16320 [Micromonospora sp. NPDC048909]|uniref:hypothetical protein n=1 Tax=Micromonospora sp. NPDC048909 TaxID=3155643 RepID=UPI0033E58522